MKDDENHVMLNILVMFLIVVILRQVKDDENHMMLNILVVLLIDVVFVVFFPLQFNAPIQHSDSGTCLIKIINFLNYLEMN